MKRPMTTAVFWSLLALSAGAQSPAAVQPASGEPALVRGVLCTAIADREPVGAPEKEPFEFKAEVGQVYFFNELRLENPPAVLIHRYYLDDKAVADVKLDLKSPRTRTWSSKKVSPGSWKVEALSEAGRSLGAVSFKVSP